MILVLPVVFETEKLQMEQQQQLQQRQVSTCSSWLWASGRAPRRLALTPSGSRPLYFQVLGSVEFACPSCVTKETYWNYAVS